MGSHALTRIPPVGECSFLKGLTRIDLAREQRRIVPRTSTAWSPSLWVRLRPRTSSCSRPRRRPGQEDRAPRRADRREPRERASTGRGGVSTRRATRRPQLDTNLRTPVPRRKCPSDIAELWRANQAMCDIHRVRFHSDRRRRVIRRRGKSFCSATMRTTAALASPSPNASSPA